MAGLTPKILINTGVKVVKNNRDVIKYNQKNYINHFQTDFLIKFGYKKFGFWLSAGIVRYFRVPVFYKTEEEGTFLEKGKYYAVNKMNSGCWGFSYNF